MCRLSDPSGFTLVEILVALTILTVGFLGVEGLGLSIIRGNLFSDRLTIATTLAQDKLEDMRKSGFSGTPATTTTTTEPYNSIATYPFYKRVTFIDVANPSAGMKMVTVTVFWNSDGSSVALRTYLAE